MGNPSKTGSKVKGYLADLEVGAGEVILQVETAIDNQADASIELAQALAALLSGANQIQITAESLDQCGIDYAGPFKPQADKIKGEAVRLVANGLDRVTFVAVSIGLIAELDKLRTQARQAERKRYELSKVRQSKIEDT